MNTKKIVYGGYKTSSTRIDTTAISTNMFTLTINDLFLLKTAMDTILLLTSQCHPAMSTQKTCHKVNVLIRCCLSMSCSVNRGVITREFGYLGVCQSSRSKEIVKNCSKGKTEWKALQATKETMRAMLLERVFPLIDKKWPKDFLCLPVFV